MKLLSFDLTQNVKQKVKNHHQINLLDKPFQLESVEKRQLVTRKPRLS